MNKGYHFKALLQNEGWISPAYVELDEFGQTIEIQQHKKENVQYTEVDGYAIPALQNAHSHAFQYAMVGLTEQHNTSSNSDDFWAWRKAMYQLALSIQPDQMEAIARMLYAEMLRHGYSQVAEFHYVHHAPSGSKYENLAELGERLVAAAKSVGIKITLVPIFYQKGGFGQVANSQQRRFISPSIASYLRLFEASEKAVAQYEGATIAYGVHSMRAVEPNLIKELSQNINANLPFHIHVSEQLKEVEYALLYLGKRPVEWLTENIELDDNYHLVHATHLTSKEVKAIAKSKANVVLCPSTEGNLGDGIFSLNEFQKAAGNWSIGTDSHIGLNPFEELRILDYGQRLTTHKRNTFTTDNEGNSGLFALKKLIVNGRKAMGNKNAIFFQKKEAFDALVLDAQAPILQICSPKNLCSTIVYASDVSMHLGTIINGKWMVKNGEHLQGNDIRKDFIHTLKSLDNR